MNRIGSNFCGSVVARPSLTACRQMSLNDLPLKKACEAGAGLFIATNHWSVSIGSFTSPLRPHRGTTILCGFSARNRPALLRSARTASRAM